MSAQIPYNYYTDEEEHGSYAYTSLENIVNNFLNDYIGDSTVLGSVKRTSVISWAKRGIRELTMDALKEYKAAEIELGDTLDVTWPFDMVNWVQISWLDQKTGIYRPMAENRRYTLADAWLQDNRAELLFDDEGYILEGTSAGEILNDEISARPENHYIDVARYNRYACADRQLWSMDTGRNYNGGYNIDPKKRRIHFGSESADRIIILVYISDGLEARDEASIVINKKAEQALYSWIYANILRTRDGVPEYEKRAADKRSSVDIHNAKVRLLNLKVAEFSQTIKQRNRWLR